MGSGKREKEGSRVSLEFPIPEAVLVQGSGGAHLADWVLQELGGSQEVMMRLWRGWPLPASVSPATPLFLLPHQKSHLCLISLTLRNRVQFFSSKTRKGKHNFCIVEAGTKENV